MQQAAPIKVHLMQQAAPIKVHQMQQAAPIKVHQMQQADTSHAKKHTHNTQADKQVSPLKSHLASYQVTPFTPRHSSRHASPPLTHLVIA